MSDAAPTTPMITATVDGRTVVVPKGTTILQAAETAGVRVPHYCYHPGLTSPAQCRLCLVEVEGAPKLAASCVTEIQEGQVVHTEGAKAKAMRQGVLEFYLQNHPLDCPICDQSGECKLQDYVHLEGREHGRSREPKRVFGRDDFGGDVLFYGDRCVMCTRCVRFMNEVAGDPRLTVVERGNRSIIDTFFEEGVEGSPFAGNIVDICPVGALVSKDFLHKARAWDLDHVPSVCPNCSQGCNVDLHVRDDVVQRLKPRANLEVNHHWMCDYGRHRYDWINRRDRIEIPLVRGAGRGPRVGLPIVASNGDGGAVPGSAGGSPEGSTGGASGSDAIDWPHALDAVAALLESAPKPVRAVASPFSSNEDLGALAELVERLGGGDVVFRSPVAPDEVPLPGFPTLVRRRDLAPNRRGAEAFGMTRVGKDDGRGGLEGLAGHAGTVVVLGDELEDVGAEFAKGAGAFLYLGSYPTGGASLANAVLPITTFAEAEGTFTNHEGRVQRFWPGVRAPGAARPAWLVLGALIERLGGAPAPSGASEAFLRAAERAPRLRGLTYETIGTGGALPSEPAALPGSRD